MTWFILSLIAILFWSGSDLFSKLGSRPDDKYRSEERRVGKEC